MDLGLLGFVTLDPFWERFEMKTPIKTIGTYEAWETAIDVGFDG